MTNTQKFRTIVFFKDYFELFYEQQREKVKAKIVWTLKLIETLPVIPETYLKHIENSKGLYEVRVQLGSDIFRILFLLWARLAYIIRFQFLLRIGLSFRLSSNP